MKKKIITAALALTLVVGSSMTALAAPEVTLNGNVFDAEYYAQNNPDVVQALGTDKTALYQHFVTFGANEGRLPFAVGTDVEAVKAAAASTETTTPAPTPTQDATNPVLYPIGTVRVDEDGSTLIYALERVEYKLTTVGSANAGHADKSVSLYLTYDKIATDASLVAKPGYEWKSVKVTADVKPDEYGSAGWYRGISIGDDIPHVSDDHKFSVTYNGMTYSECEFRYSTILQDYCYSEVVFNVMVPQGYQYAEINICGVKHDGKGGTEVDTSAFVLIPLR